MIIASVSEKMTRCNLLSVYDSSCWTVSDEILWRETVATRNSLKVAFLYCCQHYGCFDCYKCNYVGILHLIYLIATVLVWDLKLNDQSSYQRSTGSAPTFPGILHLDWPVYKHRDMLSFREAKVDSCQFLPFQRVQETVPRGMSITFICVDLDSPGCRQDCSSSILIWSVSELADDCVLWRGLTAGDSGACYWCVYVCLL